MFLLAGYDSTVALPDEASDHLRYSNHRLRELDRRYKSFASPVCHHTQWRRELADAAMDLRYFRGESAYLWQYLQVRKDARLRYYIYAQYVRGLDRRGLLGTVLTEDGQFGCFTFRFKEMPAVSRDLLDSANEIFFLERNWNLFERSDLSILDVGAGYGRLAHRMLAAVPGVSRYVCIDAIPRSTFLCEYYLGYRGLLGRAAVIPVDEMNSAGLEGCVDLAVNIHSFSEMSVTAIGAWVEWLKKLGVPALLVVPNEPDMLSKEEGGTRLPYRPLIEDAGYRLIVHEPTIRDADVRELFGVNDFFFLFERS